MNLDTEKKIIINGVIEEQNEWVLKAIKKLLDLDYEKEIPDEHKDILNERIAAYNTDQSDVLDWETIKKYLAK